MSYIIHGEFSTPVNGYQKSKTSAKRPTDLIKSFYRVGFEVFARPYGG